MSGPTISTVQVTFYVCPHCPKQHALEVQAHQCCLCDKCGSAVGTRRHSYSHECDSCHRTGRVKRARDAVRRLEDKLVASREETARLTREIETAQLELAVAKALPTNKKEGRAA